MRLDLELLEERTVLAAGDLDLSFGTNGLVSTQYVAGMTAAATHVLLLDDGGFVTAGTSQTAVNGFDFMLTRYGANGAAQAAVLTDFGGGTDQAHAALLQPDGKIVLAGVGGQNDFALARYLPNLLPDGSWGGTGKVNTDFTAGLDRALSVAIQADGKVLAAGLTIHNGKQDVALARYLPNGALDPDFDADGRLVVTLSSGNDVATDIAILPDGKILVSAVTGTSPDTQFALLRFLPDGTPDNSFGAGGVVLTNLNTGIDVPHDLEVLANGSILVAGVSADDFALVRYHANGSIDFSFGEGGVVRTDFAASTDSASSLAVQLNGKIVLAGRSTAGGDGGNFALARYHPNGTLDTTFSFDGKVLTSFGPDLDLVNDVVIQTDGKILAVGSRNDLPSAAALARYEGDAPPLLRIDDAIVFEGGGTTFGLPAVLRVTLSEPLSVTSSVTFATRNGSALAGSDYFPFSGTLVFAPGETVQDITVGIMGDLVDEPNETFFVDLSDPVAAAIAQPTGRAIIIDDDGTASALRGSVYNDANFNGVRDAGEEGISGVTIQLGRRTQTTFYVNIATTTTNASGNYSFTGLTAGDYSISEVQPTFTIDGPEQIGIVGGRATNDLISLIHLPAGVDAINYNFAEHLLFRLPLIPPLFPNRSISSPVREGDAAVLTGTIFDANPHDLFILDINWGDGSPLETHRYGPGRNGDVISLPHDYRDNGTYTVELAWRDQHGLGNSGTLEVVVTNVPPQLGNLRDLTIGPNGVLVRAIQFKDPGADTWAVRVDYGDGTVEDFSTADRQFLLKHRYAEPGDYQVRVAVIDDDGDIGTQSFTAHVRGPGGRQDPPLEALDNVFAWLALDEDRRESHFDLLHPVDAWW